MTLWTTEEQHTFYIVTTVTSTGSVSTTYHGVTQWNKMAAHPQAAGPETLCCWSFTIYFSVCRRRICSFTGEKKSQRPLSWCSYTSLCLGGATGAITRFVIQWKLDLNTWSPEGLRRTFKVSLHALTFDPWTQSGTEHSQSKFTDLFEDISSSLSQVWVLV